MVSWQKWKRGEPDIGTNHKSEPLIREKMEAKIIMGATRSDPNCFTCRRSRYATRLFDTISSVRQVLYRTRSLKRNIPRSAVDRYHVLAEDGRALNDTRKVPR
jgi:hypothetical protein